MILLIDDEVDIYSKNKDSESENGEYSRLEQTLRIDDYSPFSYVWIDETQDGAKDLKAIFSATGRKAHRQLVMRSLNKGIG